MTRAALRWIVPGLISLAIGTTPGLAWGIAIFDAVDDPVYYGGAIFEYEVFQRETFPNGTDGIEVILPDDLVLIDVFSEDSTPLLNLLDRVCGSAPASESVECNSTNGCAVVRTQIDAYPGLAVGEQVVRFTFPTGAQMNPHELRLRVRICPVGPCGTPAAEFSRVLPGVTAYRTDDRFADSCNPTVVEWDPSEVQAPREGSPSLAPFILMPMVGGLLQSSLEVPLTTRFNDAVRCRLGDGGSWAACTTAADGFGLATLTAIADWPPTIAITVANPVDPVPGNGVVRIDWSVFGLSHSPTEIGLQVQRQVALLEIATEPPSAGDPRPVASGSRTRLQVVNAFNGVGGHEPRAVSWGIAEARQGGVGVAAPDWLRTVDVTAAELTIPDDVFATGGGDWEITVRATPTDGVPGYAESFHFVVTNDWVDTCQIVLESAVALGGTSVGLRVERFAQTGTEVLTEGVTWQEPGWGEIRSTPADAAGYDFHYDAIDDNGGIHEVPSQVTLTAVVGGTTGTTCVGPEPVTIALQPAFGLSLRVDKDTVMPGGLVRLTGELNKPVGMALGGVTVVIEFGTAFKPLRKTPSTSLRVREVSDDFTAVTVGKDGVLGFTVDVPVGVTTAELSLPFMARAAFAGGSAVIRARAFYATADASQALLNTAVAKDEVTVTIVSDPEFSEATLVGKVFSDHNGDGVQQVGELGIGGAMVAVSAGVYAITDDDGKYHIAHLDPGRHSVKLNLTMLPMGSSATTDRRRDVTLTPGVFTKVSFGVAVPDLTDREPLTLDGKGSGVVLGKEGPVYRAQMRNVMGAELVARHGEHQRAAVLKGEVTYIDLPLATDGEDPVWLLVERAADGRLWLSSFAVFTYQREEGGTLVVPWGPRPIAQLLLPPEARKVGTSKLRVIGSTQARVALRIHTSGSHETCEQQSESNDEELIDCTVAVIDRIETMRVQIDPAPDPHGIDAPPQILDIEIDVEPTSHFFVGRGVVELNFDPDDDFTEGRLGDALDWNAGGAFFYKGALKGGYQVTAGADAQARQVLRTKAGSIRSIGGIGAELLAHDPRRVFRDLDPETVYPAYGDASLTVDERESGGRFFLRVEKDESYVKWGGINTAIDDAEVGRFVRSLYGLGAVLRFGDDNADGDGSGFDLRAVLFAAQPDTIPARDELMVTGGTLYFLGHRDVVEGSIRVTLEVLDEISGLPVRAVPLIEGSDYEADYKGGRFVLDAALPQRFFGTSLTAESSGGHRGRLIVAYEYLASENLTADWSTGARVIGNMGPLSIGVTGVTELTGLSDDAGELRSRYWLVGGTARVDLGDPMRLRLEFAHSDGGAFESRRSVDGGLSYGEAATTAGNLGNAAAVELTTGVGDVKSGLYGRYVEAGFTDSRNALGKRLVQGGMRVSGKFATGTSLWGNYDHLETRLFDTGLLAPGSAVRTGLQVRDLGLVGASQRLGRFNVGVEGRYESEVKRDAHRALVGVEARYQLTSIVELSLRRRQLVSADIATENGGATGESAVGVIFDDGWRLAAEAGIDDELEAFGRAQGNVPVTEDTELYAGYQIASRLGVGLLDDGQASGSSVIAGGRRSLDDGTLLYSEQNLRVDGSERMLGRTVGARVPLSKQLGVSITYERGVLDNELVADNTVLRDAASVGGTYANGRWSVRLLADGRLDRRGNIRSAELAGHGRVEFRATDDLTLALGGRGGSGFRDDGTGDLGADRRAWEGAFGFALRPQERDDINVFGRYALVYERDRVGKESGDVSANANTDAPWLASTSQVVAAALVYDIWGPFGLSPKLAYRHTRIHMDGGQGTDQALLAALRGDIHVTESWDATLEGRVCAVPNSRVDSTAGALVEVSLLVIDWLRMGAGFNFSSISAQGVRCNEPGARGLFIRAEAVY
ncbi:MAG: hypothetical protein A2289_16655 [Deltaproteobacteria bacterium RIFOXYA12_FULL_58_15]|nr:MAG: hypothetical protein A2289_16655 [Deltaproteobacteria bacterium RIFOXYA12_FULL_58_15]